MVELAYHIKHTAPSIRRAKLGCHRDRQVIADAPIKQDCVG